jgi:diguanylate cyclase (GGDEF)-like protein
MIALRLLVESPGVPALWPLAGLALALLVLLGYRLWPAVLAGAFLVHAAVTGGQAVTSSLAVAVGTTLEGLIGAWLVTRFAGGRSAFDRARDVFKFAGLAALVSTAVGATWGATSLTLAGVSRWAQYGSTWLTWWLGDAAAALVAAPVVILWATPAQPRRRPGATAEAAGLFVSLVGASLMVFGGVFPDRHYPLDFLCIPFLLWAALRFGSRVASAAVLVTSVIAVWGSLRGDGPFARGTRLESLLLLQAYLGVVSLMTLTLAAVVSARRRVAEQLRLMSVTDPLTGLANYRQLIAVLEGELRRSSRTGRPFAVLFLDVDQLKRINDRHGHLVGSRALCRVADVLRSSCRAIDTAARYGGDEFTIVLPETDEAAALQVAHRIADRLAHDAESPPVSVSCGLALYPRDGDAVGTLLGAADRDLYEAKSRTWAASRWA